MKKILWFLLLLLNPYIALALDWDACLHYKFQNAPPESWRLHDDGQGIYISDWKLTNAIPTKAELEAIEPQAIAWKSNQVAEARANLTTISPDEKQVLLGLLDCINARLGTNTISLAELKAAIKARQ